jgi:hypothetical protein
MKPKNYFRDMKFMFFSSTDITHSTIHLRNILMQTAKDHGPAHYIMDIIVITSASNNYTNFLTST